MAPVLVSTLTAAECHDECILSFIGPVDNKSLNREGCINIPLDWMCRLFKDNFDGGPREPRDGRKSKRFVERMLNPSFRLGV
jgi:hypothetical protein